MSQGSDRYDGPSAVAAIAAGDQLRRDPGNGYDRRAVSVWTADGRMLGYLPRIHNQAIAHLLDEGITPEARAGTIGGPAARPDIGVEITVVLPA